MHRLTTGGGSHGFVRGLSSLSSPQPITPTPSRQLTRGTSTTSSVRSSKAMVPRRLTSAVDELPININAGEVMDFTIAKQMFESFLRVHSHYFVFNVNKRKPVNTNQLHLSPND